MRSVGLLVLSLVFCEGLTRFALYQKWVSSNLLAAYWYESFYFYHLENAPPRATPEAFDPLLGWRNLPPYQNIEPTPASINAQGWRSTRSFVKEKTKKRIAVIGDSFSFGSGVQDDEAYPAVLEKLLGQQYEVYNFAARGYGLDQMVLVGTEVVPEYRPDYVVLSWIAADLERACYSFQFNARKPWYQVEEQKLGLKGIPVATPWETYQEHEHSKIQDLFKTWMLHSRLIQSVAEPFLRFQHRRCLSEVSPALFHEIKSKWGRQLILFNLEEIKGETLVDGHPAPSLHRLYAEALRNRLDVIGSHKRHGGW